MMATHRNGDVWLTVRFDEVFSPRPSAPFAQACRGRHAHRLQAAAAASMGAGWVEGWRGEVLVALEIGNDGRMVRCHCHDPSWQNWPVLEHAVMGNIVPDFPLINKSFNLSYSGHDL
jgi:Ni,Fe-hydrogenase III large subunit